MKATDVRTVTQVPIRGLPALVTHIDTLLAMAENAPQALGEVIDTHWTGEALGEAAKKDLADCTRVLLAAGADVDTTDHLGRTPLYFACENNSLACIRALVAAGANPVAEDTAHNSPVRLAISYNPSLPTLQTLIESGIDINARHASDGRAALHVVFEDNPLFRTENLELVMSALPDLDLKSNAGYTALHLAARNQCVNEARLLLECGADVTAVDNRGRTALDMARHGDTMKMNVSGNSRADMVELIERARACVQLEAGLDSSHAKAAHAPML